MSLRYQIREIVKEHGLTIASITLMVGTIISTIATTLIQKAAQSSAINAIKSKINDNNKSIEDKIDESTKNTNDKIDKNDKDIDDKLDKLDKKKTFWDYVKQIGLLSAIGALMKIVGKIVSFVGNTMASLGWILYAVVGAIMSIILIARQQTGSK